MNEQPTQSEILEALTGTPTPAETMANSSVFNFLNLAVTEIDFVMGDGYAKANPAVLAGYLQSCTIAQLTYTLSELQARIVVSDEPLPEE